MIVIDARIPISIIKSTILNNFILLPCIIAILFSIAALFFNSGSSLRMQQVREYDKRNLLYYIIIHYLIPQVKQIIYENKFNYCDRNLITKTYIKTTKNNTHSFTEIFHQIQFCLSNTAVTRFCSHLSIPTHCKKMHQLIAPKPQIFAILAIVSFQCQVKSSLALPNPLRSMGKALLCWQLSFHYRCNSKESTIY